MRPLTRAYDYCRCCEKCERLKYNLLREQQNKHFYGVSTVEALTPLKLMEVYLIRPPFTHFLDSTHQLRCYKYLYKSNALFALDYRRKRREVKTADPA